MLATKTGDIIHISICNICGNGLLIDRLGPFSMDVCVCVGCAGVGWGTMGDTVCRFQITIFLFFLLVYLRDWNSKLYFCHWSHHPSPRLRLSSSVLAPEQIIKVPGCFMNSILISYSAKERMVEIKIWSNNKKIAERTKRSEKSFIRLNSRRKTEFKFQFVLNCQTHLVETKGRDD